MSSPMRIEFTGAAQQPTSRGDRRVVDLTRCGRQLQSLDYNFLWIVRSRTCCRGEFEKHSKLNMLIRNWQIILAWFGVIVVPLVAIVAALFDWVLGSASATLVLILTLIDGRKEYWLHVTQPGACPDTWKIAAIVRVVLTLTSVVCLVVVSIKLGLQGRFWSGF